MKWNQKLSTYVIYKKIILYINNCFSVTQISSWTPETGSNSSSNPSLCNFIWIIEARPIQLFQEFHPWLSIHRWCNNKTHRNCNVSFYINIKFTTIAKISALSVMSIWPRIILKKKQMHTLLRKVPVQKNQSSQFSSEIHSILSFII